MVSHGSCQANPYFPGNLQIVNATILQTIQIGDDTARAGALVDLLYLYTDTVIGATTLDHDRAFSLYTQAGLVELTADGSFFFDARTKPQTQTNGAIDLHVTTAVTAVKGINIDLVTHNLANGEWAYGLMVDPNVAASVTATSSMAAIYLVDPNDTAQCDTYGLYIEAGYDFAIAALAPIKLAQLTIAPTADPTIGGGYPLDFQLEGWPTAGVYTQGRVINMEYGLARTLDGALTAIYIDFTTNLTKNGQTVTGLNLQNSALDEANLGTAIHADDNLQQTLAAVVNHTGAFLDYSSVLTCNNAGGTITANTNPNINLTLNMNQAAGVIYKSTGVFNATINRTGGTPTLSGNMINFATTGAGNLIANFTGYRLSQVWDHDDLAADAMRGIHIIWSGDLPGAQQSTLSLMDVQYTGEVGAAGALATLVGMNVNFTALTGTNQSIYGGRILVDSQDNQSNQMVGLEITKNATLAAAGGAGVNIVNPAMQIMTAITNNNAGGFAITDATNAFYIQKTHAMNTTMAATDTVTGSAFYINLTAQTGAATDTLNNDRRAFDILYTTAVGAGANNLLATDVARINVKVGANTVLAGDFNGLNMDFTGFDPNTVPAAPRTISSINVNWTGATYANSVNCVMRGATIVMPAAYQAVAVESALYMSGNTNTITALPKNFNLDMTFSEAVPGATSKAGIRITPDCAIANAVDAQWDGVYVNMTGIAFAGANHLASGMRINMVANTDHAILMQGAAAYITSYQQTLELRTTQIGAGAGPAVTIRSAAGVGTGAGGDILFVTGNAAGAAASADGGDVQWTLGNGVSFGGVAANGGGFTIIGGNCDGAAAPATAGGFYFTGGTGSGAGSTAGSIEMITGPPNGGTRGHIWLGDANVGAIALGSAGSAGSTVTLYSTAAMALISTGSTIELRTTGANNITINPGNSLAARAFTDHNDTGIINGRWEATQIHDQDDFMGTVVDPKWTNTIVLNGTIAMLIGANSVEGGAVRLAVTGVNTDAATLSRGTNRFGNTARRMVYEVKLSPSNIAAASRTRISVKMWNNGAYAGAGSYLGFEFEPNASANWFICGANAGAANRVDTGTAVVAGAYVTLRFEITAAGTCQAYINGVAAGAAVPAADVPAALLEPYIEILNDAAGQAATLDVDYEKLWQTRP